MVYIIHKYRTSQEGRARRTPTCTGGWASLSPSPQYILETRDDRRLWGRRPDSLAFGPLRTEPPASAHSPGNPVLGQGSHRRHSRGWLHFQEPAYRQCHCKGHMSLEACNNKFYFTFERGSSPKRRNLMLEILHIYFSNIWNSINKLRVLILCLFHNNILQT